MGRYKDLVAGAKKNIREISAEETDAKITGEAVILVDVRDRDEWDQEHIPKALNLSRGTLEAEIEDVVSDPSAAIILHCGAGGRSALAAESLQKMGYTNVFSMAGGLKAWKAAGLPTTQG